MTFGKLKRKAVERVENNLALRHYKYILIDDPELDGPTKSNYPPRQLDQYYRELINAPCQDLLELAVLKTAEFKDFLSEKITSYMDEIAELKRLNVDHKKILEKIEGLFSEGKKALDKDNFSDAAGYVYQAIRNLENYAYQYHRKREEPFIDIGKRVRAGGIKGHTKEYGTIEQKQRDWAEYQDYLDKKRLESPLINYNTAVKITSKHFDVCTITIQRHTENRKK